MVFINASFFLTWASKDSAFGDNIYFEGGLLFLAVTAAASSLKQPFLGISGLFFSSFAILFL